ncbi:peptidoglycan-binding protein LysM [Bifidobacterium aemilianum]|uniref:Peptidoglycan-binding protein LysM n=1 Tax=Bifidobacterium aemilianum TaxID=2493120 RepID=A0A366K9Z6_9BIFI|nr:LysM peptidoglycan-binding domain-containing protein [Bifidobacterium aemilianum]RBP98556.1 peptidoglycan-binding protein LysM [Bifidobacterium aemilianum]
MASAVVARGFAPHAVRYGNGRGRAVKPATAPSAKGAASRGKGTSCASKTTLTLRGKLVGLALVALLTWTGWSFVAPQIAQSSTGTVRVVNYTVQPGDTLWGYAAGITPDGQNVSRTVDQLMRINQLDDAALEPGQHIRVPAE